MYFPYKSIYYYFDQALPLFVRGLTGGVMPLVSVAIYVFTALSLYTIAKRRGIANAWLAWVPVANLWIVGSVSDQYRYVTQGLLRHKRIALLAWKCSGVVLLILAVVGVLAAFAGRGMTAMLILLSLVLVWLVLVIVYTVLYLMALYDIYASCDPQNAAMYLVLSIFFRFLVPIFLFISRDMEKGMPPRKSAAEPEL